jgi:hypothetical protein
LSLEVIAEQAESPKPSHISADHWDSLLRAADFDSEERAFIYANKLERIARRKLPEYLGWQPRQVEAVRVRVQRRFAELKENRLDVSVYEYECALTSAYGSVFCEVLPSGQNVYSMRIPEPFPSKPKPFLMDDVSGQCSKWQSLGAISVKPRIITRGEREMQLESKLQQARLDAARIWGEIEKAENDLSGKERDLAAARKDLEADEENSVLADRQPSAKLIKRVSEVETAVQVASKRVEVCQRAHKRAEENCMAIQNEIEASKFERLRSAIAGPAERLRAAQDEFIEAAIDADAVLRQFSAGSVGADLLFPRPNPADPLEGATLRLTRLAVVRAARDFVQVQSNYGVRRVS